MKPFRLLHLSDFHIALQANVIGVNEWQHLPRSWFGLDRITQWFGWTPPRTGEERIYPFGDRGLRHPSSYHIELALAVARFAYLKRLERLDGILITGDLATTGRAADLTTAFQYVNDPVQDRWLTQLDHPTLQAGPPHNNRILLIPGNHDRYQGLRFYPGGTEFDNTFQNYWDGKQRVQTLFVFRKGTERLAVIGADFCLKHQDDANAGVGKSDMAYLGQGRAYVDVSIDLQAETQYWNDQNAAVIWAVHFPPGFAGVDPSLTFLDDFMLLDAAWRMGVEHIFCGHTHVPRQYSVVDSVGGRRVNIYCAGTAMQYCAPPPNTNTVHRFNCEVENGRVHALDWQTWRWKGTKFERVNLPPSALVYRP
jgi:3',5'-cyclic AMP phosphodiesterase CpdA